MQNTKKNAIPELKAIISKMPIEVFCMAALPDFGVSWSEVSKAVRNARLPMHPTSVARVLCRHVSRALPDDEVEDIVARLRLKLVATQTRTWHLIRLSEQTTDEPITNSVIALRGRVLQALRKNKAGLRPEVQTVLLGDMMFMSLQLKSDYKNSSVLYVATPPGEPVALVSSPTMARLLKACVEGLGYRQYINANLHGRDIKSLLRINNGSWNANVDHLAEMPEYAPMPVITDTGIDYTNKQYDEDFVDKMLGPNPPVITDLNLLTKKMFFDRSVLDKKVNLSVSIKSDDLAKTLKAWASKGAITPDSDFFKIFRQMTSNKITYTREDSD